jgi:hypothetical protein
MATEKRKKKSHKAAAAASGLRVRFNIGGTKYEVSRSVIDKFPDSMLAKICSDTWNNNDKTGDDDDGTDDESEIFIERDGERFRYVLDYMRDGSVQIPLSIPRGQLVMDLEYYGIDYADESITLSVADPTDLFHSLARYEEYFTKLEAEIEVDFKVVVARKVACAVAKGFFGVVCSGKPAAKTSSYYDRQESATPARGPTYFAAQPIVLRLPLSNVYIATKDLQPHLRAVGLCLSSAPAVTYRCDASVDTTFTVTLLKPSA